ncbi:MAG: TRAP transporter substrate-binding protein DctP [Arhodomonas sp.]|nr:TRAP transporter substrate-binding protein DctP [Arhodomonas sp.]
MAAHYFAEELENEAPGEFDMKFFPNHQLGNDTEMLQGMQLGTLDAGVITGTQVGQLDSGFQLNDLPFLYANNAQAHAVLDGESGPGAAGPPRLPGHRRTGLPGGGLPARH